MTSGATLGTILWGDHMKIAFYTLGCKTNQFETQALEQLFTARGHELTDFSARADVYIINTCTVTALGDKKSRAAARRAKRLNPACTLIVCGCYAQVKPDEVRALCGADLVLGTSEKGRIVEFAEAAQAGRAVSYEIPPALTKKPFEALPAGGLSGRTRALLKIQDGCQNFCAYCLIPFARGPSRSLPFDEAVAECARLAREGYREIVVTGIEISSYGLDLTPASSLGVLLPALCEAAPGVRIRLGSLEPRTVTESFVRALAAHPNLCPHFHLSLQSGCDKTLRAMGRRYDTARFLESCETLRRFFPRCAITTDLIVGFPGETEEDFAQTLAFLRTCALAQVHIFPYSRRSGTRAATMPDQVSKADKELRAAEAARVCDALHETFLRSFLGEAVAVLFEQEENGGFTGHTPEYCPVWAPGAALHNECRRVRITEVANGRLIGALAP